SCLCVSAAIMAYCFRVRRRGGWHARPTRRPRSDGRSAGQAARGRQDRRRRSDQLLARASPRHPGGPPRKSRGASRAAWACSVPQPCMKESVRKMAEARRKTEKAPRKTEEACRKSREACRATLSPPERPKARHDDLEGFVPM